MRLNGCPCGYHGDPFKECTCSPGIVEKYQRRISGPLLDRIDLFIGVPRVEYDKLLTDDLAESSEVVRNRVQAARNLQRKRFAGSKLGANADMTPVEAREFCRTDDTAQGLLHMAMRQFHLSARSFHRILKVSRTIADLADAPLITAAHMAEALQYRTRSMA